MLSCSIAAGLVCKGASFVLGDAAVIEVSSDQYFLPLLLFHNESRAQLAALLGAEDRAADEHWKMGGEITAWDDGELEALLVRHLGQWLLRPVLQVRRAVVAFEQQHFAPPTHGTADQTGAAGSGFSHKSCLVGVHVRVPMFDFELRQVCVHVRPWL